MEVSGISILLTPLDSKNNLAPSIDRLFSSLAAHWGKQAIALILSGSGHDGSIGAEEIRKQGGIVIAQYPNESVQPAMPEAAIQAGVTDLVGRTTEIADWLNNPDQLLKNKSSVEDNQDTRFKTLFSLVVEKTNFELARYKDNTLKRQTIKRYLSLGFENLSQYLAYIDNHPEEITLLQQCFLISVSSFFRDLDAFSALKLALKNLLEKKADGDPLRIWIPGCATGEEPYSIAIILAELLDHRFKSLDIRIFATDIDLEALDFARNAIYPQAALQAVSEKYLRWFTPQGTDWQINKDLRELCVFSSHDITSQPPFIKLDLISCRNLLIYFKPEQQADLISMFHYGLNSNGLLLLGKSESVGQKATLFTPVASEQKLFRRVEVSTPFPMRYGRYSTRLSLPLHFHFTKSNSQP